MRSMSSTHLNSLDSVLHYSIHFNSQNESERFVMRTLEQASLGRECVNTTV